MNAKALGDQGNTWQNNPKAFRDLAKEINRLSGRGNLPKWAAQAIPILNAFYFSPRFNWSRLEVLNIFRYAAMSPQARKEGMATMAKYAGGLVSLLWLIKANGGSVETDPVSSDVGKARVGDTRFDPWAGLQQWAVFGSRMATGETKPADEDRQKTSRRDVLYRMSESKLAPVPGTMMDVLRGKTYVGEEVTPQGVAMKNLLPMYTKDVYEAFVNDGWDTGTAAFAAGIFGIGVTSYKPK